MIQTDRHPVSLIKELMCFRKWATASPRFIVPDNMLIDAVERARRDVRKIKDRYTDR